MTDKTQYKRKMMQEISQQVPFHGNDCDGDREFNTPRSDRTSITCDPDDFPFTKQEREFLECMQAERTRSVVVDYFLFELV